LPFYETICSLIAIEIIEPLTFDCCYTPGQIWSPKV